jgi:hypothetical protein
MGLGMEEIDGAGGAGALRRFIYLRLDSCLSESHCYIVYAVLDSAQLVQNRLMLRYCGF